MSASTRKNCGLGLFTCLVPFIYSVQVLANNQVTDIPFSGIEPGSVGLGAGRRIGTSPYKYIETVSSLLNDKNSDLVPLYLYEGKYFFARGTSAGLHLYKSQLQLDLLAHYRFDRLETDANEFYNGVNERQQTTEGGLALTVAGLNLTWLNDLQSRHNGQEVSLTYRFNWNKGNFQLSPYVSLIYQDSDLVNYYYAVSDEESRSDLPVYTTGSTNINRVGINTTYYLLENWLLFLNLSVENLGSEIYNSPLVDRDRLNSAYLGFSYTFGNAYKTISQNNAISNLSGWSWRIHGGYTAEETFHKVHRGYIKPAEDIDTYLAGITLGRLLSDGEQADFWLKASINRRLENDYQNNFNEYNFYVMAMGAGYSPWSDREVFRYGFGFGFSYADKIPYIEQVKQARRGGSTSHFLNYLEAQLDFPMRNFSDAESVKDCYLGLTIIHRSGIFATSDMLGNVAGGSDVLAGHIECKR